MLHLPIDTPHSSKSWQQQLAEAFTNLNDLCAYLKLSITDLAVSEKAMQQFPLKVPRSFAAAMEKGNPEDPLLLQVLPLIAETFSYPGFSADPVGDLAAVTAENLIHKYHARVLMINTGSCAINCRYCFRRNFPYGDFQLSKQKLTAALDYLQKAPEITEVILSGGDPLLLSDQRLQQLFLALAEIPHLQRIRIHTRLPIVLPARITPSLLEIFQESSQSVVMVVHCNHAQELTLPVGQALRQLSAAQITVFNQSVLLKGINDSALVLAHLSEQLFRYGVIPYYLHQLDKAQGTGHFAVTDEQALEIMNTLQNTLPGYLVPRLVREVAGAPAKTPVVTAG